MVHVLFGIHQVPVRRVIMNFKLHWFKLLIWLILAPFSESHSRIATPGTGPCLASYSILSAFRIAFKLTIKSRCQLVGSEVKQAWLFYTSVRLQPNLTPMTIRKEDQLFWAETKRCDRSSTTSLLLGAVGYTRNDFHVLQTRVVRKDAKIWHCPALARNPKNRLKNLVYAHSRCPRWRKPIIAFHKRALSERT